VTRAITISDSNFKRIQKISEPLVDSVDSVLERLLDAYERNRQDEAKVGTSADTRLATAYLGIEVVKQASGLVQGEYDSFDPPDLTHTGINSAKFGGAQVNSPNWNVMLEIAIRQAVRKLGSVEALRKVVPINVMDGKKTDQGYRYLADVNVSVQGQSAKDAWKATAKIARRLGRTVHVQFYWQNKEGAEHPGEIGIFRIVGAEM